MIERLLVAYLTPHLPDVWVATRVPNPRPERLVRIEAAGGARQNVRQDHPRCIVQAWALYDADLLMAEVVNLLSDMVGRQVTVPTREGFATIQVYSIDIDGPSNFPDPDSDMPRYQCTVSVRHSH